MPYTTLFFDLDDTLYPSDNGLWDAIRGRMSQYMAERLGLPWDVIPDMRRMYYETYGTTLRGLQIHYQVDAEEYLDYVHDLPLDTYLRPNPKLRAMLSGLPQQLWIFTNADADHAQRVLRILEIQDCFQGIIDVRAIEFACKPEPVAYQRALSLAGVRDRHRCVLLDDSALNLEPAHRLGLTTVLVGNHSSTDPWVDFYVPETLALAHIMPELWDSENNWQSGSR
jgi:putative hydrolase of the HAD superfamily